jgi:hypothetical protein
VIEGIEVMWFGMGKGGGTSSRIKDGQLKGVKVFRGGYCLTSLKLSLLYPRF